MSKPPFRRTSDPRQAAEAAFKAVTRKPEPPAPAPAARSPAPPNAKEMVPIRLDRDVLEHFQADGPGWQERINEALRVAAGLRRPGPADEGLRPDQLTTENDL
jgi:uncharacterized protein (DUF4415 family)